MLPVKKNHVTVSAKAGQKTAAPDITIPASPVPDLIPDKGVLLDFTPASAARGRSFYRNLSKILWYSRCFTGFD